MPEVHGGEIVVRTLKTLGADTIFGLPGIHALAIYDALLAHPEVRHIMVRHEQTAAYAADGFARVSGRPGVCITTTGPGAANSAGAMGTAYTDSVPVLNVMSNIPADLVDRQKGFLHEAKDQMALFAALTSWNGRATRPQEIPAALTRAFEVMLTRRPRPTAVEITTDALVERVDIESVPWLREAPQFAPPPPDAGSVQRAADLLAGAERPFIWAGGGVNRSVAEESLQRLAERLGAPVATTIQGMGVIPADHPLATVYRPFERPVAELVAQADVLLAVGTRFTHRQTGGWRMTLPQHTIHVTLDEEDIGRNYPAEVAVIGDARATLEAILQALPGGAEAAPRSWADLATVREAVHHQNRERGPAESAVMDALRRVPQRDAVFVVDQTKPAYWMARAFPAYAPRTFIYPGYGTLGFAFPTALGVKVALPDRQVICICGDGGFQFALPELATAVQFGINFPVVMFNDNQYGVLGDLQDIMFEGRHFAIDLLNPDFQRLVESYGLRAVRLQSGEGLAAALDQALHADRMTVIEVPVAFSRPRA